MFSGSLVNEVNALRGSADLGSHEVFVNNLVFVYYMILASGPLCEFAEAKTSDAEYHKFLREHADEEKNHADWLFADIQDSGHFPALQNHDLMFAASEIAGSQYYKIFHISTYALLGYMLALECTPMPEEVVAALETRHGKTLCRTLRHHSVRDVEHGAEVRRQIDIMPPAYRELVRQTALRTVSAINAAARLFGAASAASATVAHGSADKA